jgi:hypothetical protein
MIDLQPLITPAVAVAFFGGMWKVLTDLLNHKATDRTEKQTDALSVKLEEGFKAMGNKIDEGNNKVVSAVLSLKQ